jgi:hypothetical protein
MLCALLGQLDHSEVLHFALKLQFFIKIQYATLRVMVNCSGHGLGICSISADGQFQLSASSVTILNSHYCVSSSEAEVINEIKTMESTRTFIS